MSTGQSLARRGPQSLVPSQVDQGDLLLNLQQLARRDWERDPEVVREEAACLQILKEKLRGEICHHGPGTDSDLFEDMLNGRRQAVRLRDLIRVIRNSRLSLKAGAAADHVIRRLAASRNLVVIPMGSTNDRRHQPSRRQAERRRA